MFVCMCVFVCVCVCVEPLLNEFIVCCMYVDFVEFVAEVASYVFVFASLDWRTYRYKRVAGVFGEK